MTEEYGEVLYKIFLAMPKIGATAHHISFPVISVSLHSKHKSDNLRKGNKQNGNYRISSQEIARTLKN